jgi:ferredoxin
MAKRADMEKKAGVEGRNSSFVLHPSSFRLSPSSLLRVSKLRFTVQALCFVLFVYAGLLGLRRLTVAGREMSLPTLSCEFLQHKVVTCYLYDLQVFLTRGATERYISLIEPTVIFLTFCFLFGRAWCGWICPLGFLQDLVSDLRAAPGIGLGFLRAGPRTKRVFAITAYSLLGLAVFLAIFIGRPESRLYPFAGSLATPYCQICPALQLLPLAQGDAKNLLLFNRDTAVSEVMSVLGIVTVVLFLLLTPVMRRFWCRLCALGILLRFLRVNRWAMLGLVKEPRRCTYCGSCERACPVEISEVFEERKRWSVRLTECHLCLKCVEACGEDNVLQARWLGATVFRSRLDYVCEKFNGKSVQ